ncbi:endonuclease III domain-containing protein [Halodesulfovibrio sp.]|jgi:endonuclease-3 related protein|uniref:endonuclease III domain-containing protein n=2 Tax=Halodesulfovibrio sp. TaxID=1912772 RepID=UPI0025CFB0F8|nr:endonuclease III domain-containing protein [Halodesulfovibrio sp.]MCT4626696.1 endonuclease III domain-containing protein [Halodesulfovibrio sp.]
MNREKLLMDMFTAMQDVLGTSKWWHAESAFEVMVGAVLTQNTNWNNVEKAINTLKQQDVLTPQALLALPQDELATLIRPAGYYNVKAKRLQNLVRWFRDTANYSFAALDTFSTEELRTELLSVNGIGQETADSILLYALNRPSFVVDAYTRRIFNRHSLVSEDIYYEELRDFFMDVLPEDTQLFNKYHALIVRVAKEWCLKKTPRCETCPLKIFLE